ncbi:MAG: glutathione S-transferase family protein [Pseudohongiellaceae bacterium]
MTSSRIDLYTWNTPNGRKVSIMLEEIGANYRVYPIDITKGEQHEASFLKISPNNKIPAIVDHETGIQLMESGAILMYLASKSGQLMSPIGPSYWQEIEWLMFQMGGVGPMLGQTHHFVKFNAGKSAYAEERYSSETARLYGVLEQRLKTRQYICEDYSIADIATWPWISRFEWQQMDLNDFPNLREWYLRIAERPAVQRGYGVPQSLEIPMPA